jgi:hypothetical protein
MPGSPADFDDARRLGDEDGSRPLWLIPILLRDRAAYYDDWADATQRDFDRVWKSASASMTRDAFEAGLTAEQLWGPGPLWWGVNDVVGYVEIRLHPAERALRVTAFRTTARPSRSLVKKFFEPQAERSVTWGAVTTNEELRAALREAVEEVSADATRAGRQIARQEWEALIRHTDVLGVVNSLGAR